MEKDYETFIRDLEETISEITGIEEEKIQFEEKGGKFSKEGDRLLIEFAEHENTREVCALYTEELYGYYREGSSLEELAREILQDIDEVRNSGIYEKTQDMGDYEKIKDSLFIRLLNEERNRESLKDAIYRTIGDIALVLYAEVSEREGCITSTKIHKDMPGVWKVDRDEVFREALLNTYFISPPRIYRWEQMLFDPEYKGENFMDLVRPHILKKDSYGNCLSTDRKTNGAVAVFLPGVAERLGELLDSDFYIVFTSIHEVMIHDVKNVSPEHLEEILADTLKTATPEEDYLTSRIYHYSRENHRFTCVSHVD